MGSVPDFDHLRLPRLKPDFMAEGAGVERWIRYLFPAYDESEIVINADLSRRRKIKKDFAFGVGLIGHAVFAVELDAIGRIPEQSFLTIIQTKNDFNVAAVEQQRMVSRFIPGF